MARVGLCAAYTEMSLAPKMIRLPCAGTVAIISAGTSDEHIAEECRATADVMGCYCFRAGGCVRGRPAQNTAQPAWSAPHLLHVTGCRSIPFHESQHAPCNNNLKSRDSCACTDC